MSIEQTFRGPSNEQRLHDLRAEHTALEGRLTELDQLVYLTPDERYERKRVQKLKLHKKDQIQQMREPNGGP